MPDEYSPVVPDYCESANFFPIGLVSTPSATPEEGEDQYADPYSSVDYFSLDGGNIDY